jgi:hypothetical protein
MKGQFECARPRVAGSGAAILPSQMDTMNDSTEASALRALERHQSISPFQ